MKTTMMITSMLVSLSALGVCSKDQMEQIDSKICPQKTIKNCLAICKGNSSSRVLTAAVGSELTSKEIQNLKADTFSSIDLGLIPDADTNTAYWYTRWLLDKNNKKNGLITIEGVYNEETGDVFKTTVRYDLKGKVNSISISEIRQ